MIFKLQSTFVFLFLVSNTFAQQPIIIEKTDLTEVKLYQNGAYISRLARTQLNEGFNEVVFKNLSPYINSQTLTVKGMGDATILNVSFKQNYLKDKYKPKEITMLESNLDTLNYKYQQVLNTSAILKEKESLLLANKSIGGANNGVLADELEPMMDYFSAKLTEIKDDMLNNSLKEKKLREQIEKIKNELNNRNNKNNLPEGNIVIEVNAKGKGNATFELGYLIATEATWYSFYDIRTKDVNSPVQIIYKAKIIQNTGENWENTKLRLSTANPQAGSVKPELYPWYLNFNVPQVLLKGTRDMRQNYQIQGDAPAVMSTATPEMKSVEVTLSQSQLSSEFTVAIPYTIMSDGQEHQVDIQSFSLPAVFEYVALPKLDVDAFLTARIAGWEDLSLTPGAANIYFDGAYVGESYINPLETGDTLTLSLGRDKKIIVKREKLKEFSSSKLFGNIKERSFTYEISVKNTKKEALNIVIQDQVPISQDKEIEVKITELSNGVLNDVTGKTEWRLAIQPNENKKVRLSYTVKFPKNKQVSGL